MELICCSHSSLLDFLGHLFCCFIFHDWLACKVLLALYLPVAFFLPLFSCDIYTEEYLCFSLHFTKMGVPLFVLLFTIFCSILAAETCVKQVHNVPVDNAFFKKLQMWMLQGYI